MVLWAIGPYAIQGRGAAVTAGLRPQRDSALGGVDGCE